MLAHTTRAAHPKGREAGSRRGIQVGKVSDTTGNRFRSKKTLILEYREAHALKQAAMPELKAIEAELRVRLGDRGKTSSSYIAHVLRAAGTRVKTDASSEGRYVDTFLEEPYATRLSGLLQFGDFETAEKSLRNLDTAHREYLGAGNHSGARLVRALALKGKLRAQSLAANPRVNPEKREEKQEIANWFRVWLQSPDLFSDWLGLRRQSEEFQQKFGKQESLREE
jgi:hypothetical protein